MMTPPATCDSQPSLLTIRPQSCTATTFVQRTWPVSVSTSTSATCTPPTPDFEMPRFSGLSASLEVHEPVALACSMPSLAQASFQAHDLPRVLSTTLPTSILRSSFLEPSLPATLSKKSSSAAAAACNVAGACDGQVVLPPEPDDAPIGLSPIL